MALTRFFLIVVLLNASFVACSKSYKPIVVDTNSNWLKTCDTSGQCGGDLRCVCGICTTDCSGPDDCEALSSDASCIEAESTASGDICLSGTRSEPIRVCVLSCQNDADCSHLSRRAQCVNDQCINRAPLSITDPSSPGRCDPFLDIELPLKLGDLVMAAKDSQDTVYATYESSDDTIDFLVFVSDGDVLYRKEVSGSGEGNEGEREFYTFMVADEAGGFTLLYEIDADNNKKAAKVPIDDYEGRIDDIPQESELLELLEPSAVQNLEKKNLPGYISVEYLAEVEDGRIILVVRPEYDWSYDDFELFLGTADKMQQYEVTEVQRARDGGSTEISFNIDSTSAVVFFPVNLSRDTSDQREPKLTVGDREFVVEELDPGAMDLSEFVFICDPPRGLYQAKSNLEVTVMDLPQAECDGCRFNNSSIWGFSESALYVTSNIATGGGTQPPHSLLRYFDGQEWSTLYDAGIGTYFYLGWGSSPADIYLYSKEQIFHYDGNVVEETDAPSVPIATSYAIYTGVLGESANRVLALGVDGMIVRYDGSRWEEVQAGNSTEHLTGFWGASIDDIYAISENGMVFHFDGVNWSALENNMVGMIDLSIDGLNAIWGSSPDNIYAISGNDHSGDGVHPAFTGPGQIMRYDGQQWSLAQFVEKDALLAISGSSSDNIHVVGASRDGDGVAHPVIWSYNGARWERTLLSDLREVFLGDIWCSPSGKCFVPGPDNTVLSLDRF